MNEEELVPLDDKMIEKLSEDLKTVLIEELMEVTDSIKSLED